MVAVLIVGATAAAWGGSTPPLDTVLNTMSSVTKIEQTVIAPDGKHVAWVQSTKNADGSRSRCYAIFVRGVDEAGAQPLRVTAGGKACEEGTVGWAPNSRQLAFLSDAEDGDQQQIYVAGVESGAARQLTHVKGSIDDLKWSPDGKTVAALWIQDAPRKPGPLEAMSRDAGVVEEHLYEQRLALVDASSGTVQQITPADMYVYEYDWSPDGSVLAATAAHGSGDNNWWIAELYTVDRQGRKMQSVYKPEWQIATPRWSPDGKNIAFIQGIMSDQGSSGGDIYVVAAAGGKARNVTPGIQTSPSWLYWISSKDGDAIVFAELADGMSGIGRVNPRSGQVEQLQAEPVFAVSEGWGPSFSIAHDGRFASAVSSALKGLEVMVGSLADRGGAKEPPIQVTHVNQDVQPLWGEHKSVHWTTDGHRVQGWLMMPYQYDPGKRYPMVVEVHGGPSSACYAAWPSHFDGPLASQGYLVLCPNPRGSYGQGEAFTLGNVKDFGYGDLRDILGGVDQVLKDYPVDPKRVGITGWSYGGYMTMWAVTQTQRFRAAVSGAGLSNWQSYYGENDIDQWMIPFFGASVYDDPKVYERSSPITFIKNVKTPTLLLVGERDGEVPAPQSYEFWHALKTLGVKTQLVVYPDEGHAISKPEHHRDVQRRLVEWFNDNMAEGGGSASGAGGNASVR